MQIMLDCLPCMLKQSLEAARLVTDDEKKQEEILKKAMVYIQKYESYKNSPELARDIHNMVKLELNNKDPYYNVKKQDIEVASKLSGVLTDFLKSRNNEVYWAVKTAATGNNIDSAIYQNIDIEECVKNELDKPFELCDLDIFEEKLSKADIILIIGDNSGETVFDKVMIESMGLKKTSVFYAVRSEPTINDTTEKEAVESGLSEVAQIISSGCSSPGLILENCSVDFLEIYNKADLIISKGQGNYEALSEEKGNVFFLLKAKCNMIARILGVEVGSYVLKYNGEDNK